MKTASVVIEGLRVNRSDVPLIVLVDRADMDEYYVLFCAGDYVFFEIADGALAIADALRWAAHARVVPPRSFGMGRPTGAMVRERAAAS
jgi:hypothetical protein